jgi:hypothetical protein
MNLCIGRSLRVATAIVLVMLLAGCADPKAKWRAEGRVEAERDIASEKLRLKGWGYPAPWSAMYKKMTKDELGVEVETVAGCVVTEEQDERWGGFNERMNEEVYRRFGPGALDKVAKKAQERYKQETEKPEGAK